MCIVDHFLLCPGFHDLAAKLISIGATYGKVELVDIKQVTITLHLIAIECSLYLYNKDTI